MANKPTALVAMMLVLTLGGLLLMGAKTWDFLVYVLDTPTVKVAWDPSEGATRYDWRLIWIDPSLEFEQLSGSVSGSPVEIPRPRSGHFRVEVRACNDAGCSDWAVSTVSGYPKPWIVYWKLPPPVIGQ